MKRLVILASGAGSNSENIIRYFDKHPNICVVAVLSNKQNSGVIERAKRLNIQNYFFSDKDFIKGSKKLLEYLKKNADYIILAGFLSKVSKNIIQNFTNKIINIHPSLLPKFGGKGMYGMNVHKAVKEKGETKTGITIHYANENYDKGEIIFQKEIYVSKTDTYKDIAKNIHKLEYEYFPKIIEKILLEN